MSEPQHKPRPRDRRQETVEIATMLMDNPALAPIFRTLAQARTEQPPAPANTASLLPVPMNALHVQPLASNPAQLAAAFPQQAVALLPAGMPMAFSQQLVLQLQLQQQQPMPAPFAMPVNALAMQHALSQLLVPSLLPPQLQPQISEVTSVESDGTNGAGQN